MKIWSVLKMAFVRSFTTEDHHLNSSLSGTQRHVQQQQQYQQKVNPNYSNNNQGIGRPSAEASFQRNPQNHQAAYRRQPSDPSQKCDCCPFGYHIDLDFMRICDEISSGVNLREIKKPSKVRSRKKYGSASGEVVSPPAPPRSSSVNLERKTKSTTSPKEKEGSSSQVDDIFSKENQEFWGHLQSV